MVAGCPYTFRKDCIFVQQAVETIVPKFGLHNLAQKYAVKKDLCESGSVKGILDIWQGLSALVLLL